MAEDPEDRRSTKLAAAALRAVKTAGWADAAGKWIAGAARGAARAPGNVVRSMQVTKPGGARGFGSAPLKAAPSQPISMNIGGQAMKFAPSGAALHPSATGGPAMPPTPGAQAGHIRNSLDRASNWDKHRLDVQLGRKADSTVGRFAAKAKDFAAHPAAPMLAPMVASTALGMIPAGRDEYGRKRSLAQTTAGSMVANVGLPLGLVMNPHMFRPQMGGYVQPMHAAPTQPNLG